MSSNSIRRHRQRAFEAITEIRDETVRNGRATRPAAGGPESFYSRPEDADALVSFENGVGAALRQHLRAQGLTELADQVDQLESLGRRIRKRTQDDHSVSALVYQMH